MRLFLAFILQEEIKEKLNNNFSLLKNIKEIKFVKKENLHITLLFLGNCNLMLLNSLNKIFCKIIPTYQKFTLKFFSLDLIPKNNPNLFWISYFSNNKEIYNLPLKLNTKLKNIISIKDNENFIFHTTLARMKKDFSSEIRKSIQLNKLDLPNFEIKKLALFQSKLSKNGVEYTILEEYFLK